MVVTKEQLLEIFEHFGRTNQIAKLREEVDELVDAILVGDKANIEEEYADVSLVLLQLAAACDLEREQVYFRQVEKLRRTLDRIESGYYEEDR